MSIKLAKTPKVPLDVLELGGEEAGLTLSSTSHTRDNTGRADRNFGLNDMSDLTDNNGPDHRALLESLNEGVYATDRDRRIVYWNRSAERITGWRAEDIVGRRCSDDVLCHVDKEGHRLCGAEQCPLNRAIVTGHSCDVPVVVLGHGKNGQQIPMRVSVAPVRNAADEVVGGVEMFRDISTEFRDAQTARNFQRALLGDTLPQDPRVTFSTHYAPWGMIGGDHYALSRLDDDHFGLMLADVSGHGVAAALYTIYLDALWRSHQDLVTHPGKLAGIINTKLSALPAEDGRLVTAIFGLLDLKQMRLVLAHAGGPDPLLFRGDGNLDVLHGSGLLLGYLPEAEYEEHASSIQPGDCLLAFTDGALEIVRGSDNSEVRTRTPMRKLSLVFASLI